MFSSFIHIVACDRIALHLFSWVFQIDNCIICNNYNFISTFMTLYFISPSGISLFRRILANDFIMFYSSCILSYIITFCWVFFSKLGRVVNKLLMLKDFWNFGINPIWLWCILLKYCSNRFANISYDVFISVITILEFSLIAIFVKLCYHFWAILV